MLDGETDDLQDGPWHCFEQGSLLTRPLLVPAVIQHIFSELEDRFATDRPALVLMDDAAVTWALPDYEKKGKEWMVTTAKKNVSLGFFTHSLEQVFSSPLGTLLIESTPQTFAFPNKAAEAPAIRDIYVRLGFNDQDIHGIATGRVQQDCYYACEGWGKRLFHIYLSPLLRAIIHRNTVEDHALMDAVRADVGRERFGVEWLRRSGFPEAAHQLAQWQNEAFDAAAD
jgi:type IV secretion system protein TrbE